MHLAFHTIAYQIMLHFGYILCRYFGHNAGKAEVLGVQNPKIILENPFVRFNLLKLVHLV